MHVGGLKIDGGMRKCEDGLGRRHCVDRLVCVEMFLIYKADEGLRVEGPLYMHSSSIIKLSIPPNKIVYAAASRFILAMSSPIRRCHS
jgi:hypothetical protein